MKQSIDPDWRLIENEERIKLLQFYRMLYKAPESKSKWGTTVLNNFLCKFKRLN